MAKAAAGKAEPAKTAKAKGTKWDPGPEGWLPEDFDIKSAREAFSGGIDERRRDGLVYAFDWSSTSQGDAWDAQADRLAAGKRMVPGAEKCVLAWIATAEAKAKAAEPATPEDAVRTIPDAPADDGSDDWDVDIWGDLPDTEDALEPIHPGPRGWVPEGFDPVHAQIVLDFVPDPARDGAPLLAVAFNFLSTGQMAEWAHQEGRLINGLPIGLDARHAIEVWLVRARARAERLDWRLSALASVGTAVVAAMALTADKAQGGWLSFVPVAAMVALIWAGAFLERADRRNLILERAGE